MDWFLYDRDLRHERVKRYKIIAEDVIQNHVSQYEITGRNIIL